MSISSLFFKGAVLWFVAGTSVGMQMGFSGNHGFIDAHAHLNLLGWVSSALFGCFYALHPAVAAKRRAWVHFSIYNAGLVLMLPSLYLVQAGYEWAEPLMAIGSALTWAGVIVFATLVVTAPVLGKNGVGELNGQPTTSAALAVKCGSLKAELRRRQCLRRSQSL